jgi:sulfatase maturation enzyme AslB (radical SAM superfamily)
MQAEQIKWLQVENTTRCNAWCPACARNKNGFELIDGLVLEDLDASRFEQILCMFPNLEAVQFCGTYGDFAAAKNVIEHTELAKKYSKKIQIHTHGGIRDREWWRELAIMLSDTEHDVWFALDGLKGIHEIYRQGTDFDKTIDNAKAFIDAGGTATWQFIPWAHNEHQIKDCMKLSQQLGFKKFKLVKSVRKDFSARHWKTGEEIMVNAWSMDKQYNRREEFFSVKDQVLRSDCMHLSLPSVYVNANGMISSCCEFNLHRTFESFEKLPNIESEIESQPHQTCLRACGSCATITTEKNDTN